MVLCAACGGGGGGGGAGSAAEEPGRVRALVARAQADTVRFEAGAVARHCGTGPAGGLLLEGATEGKGNGVLIWLRSGDSLEAGEYPLLAPGDTTTPRGGGAMVSVRYMTADIAHGFVLDSGGVAVTRMGRRGRGRLSARAWGSGLEVGAGTRVALDAVFKDVPVAADTVSCRVRS